MHKTPNLQPVPTPTPQTQLSSLDQKYSQYKSHIDQAHKLEDQRKYDQAQVCYYNALELNPDSYEANLYLGLIMHRDKKKLPQAIQFYKKASKCQNSSYQPFYLLGIVHNILKNEKKSMYYFDITIKFNPKILQAYYYKGMLCLNKFKDVKTALQCFQKVRQLNKNWFKVYQCLLNCYNHLKKDTEIYQMFQNLIQNYPKQNQPYQLAEKHYLNKNQMYIVMKMYDRREEIKREHRNTLQNKFQNIVFLEDQKCKFDHYRSVMDLEIDDRLLQNNQYNFFDNVNVQISIAKSKQYEINNYFLNLYQKMYRILEYYLSYKKENHKKYSQDMGYCRVLLGLESSKSGQKDQKIDSRQTNAMLLLVTDICFQLTAEKVVQNIIDYLGKEVNLDNIKDIVDQFISALNHDIKIRDYLYKQIVKSPQSRPWMDKIKKFIQKSTATSKQITFCSEKQYKVQRKDNGSRSEEHLCSLFVIMMQNEYGGRIRKQKNPFVEANKIWMEEWMK